MEDMGEGMAGILVEDMVEVLEERRWEDIEEIRARV